MVADEILLYAVRRDIKIRLSMSGSSLVAERRVHWNLPFEFAPVLAIRIEHYAEKRASHLRVMR